MGYTRQRQTQQKQSRETDNIGYTRQRQTKQKQSRETGNIWYTRQRQTKQKHKQQVACTFKTNSFFRCLIQPLRKASTVVTNRIAYTTQPKDGECISVYLVFLARCNSNCIWYLLVYMRNQNINPFTHHFD
jgi:hypothetical protein